MGLWFVQKILPLVLVVLFVTACGGSPDVAAPPVTTTAAPPVTTTAASAVTTLAPVPVPEPEPEPESEPEPEPKPSLEEEWEPEWLDPVPGKEWFPGTYLSRHCEQEEWTEEEVCGADLMLGLDFYAEIIRLPKSSEQVYGVSQYLRIFEFLERVPTRSQFGVWGQWIGSLGAHPNGAFNSIEGGLFVADKMGRSRFPKYMASAATHLYSPDSDTTGGWGFYERRIDCSQLGRVSLSNHMLVPPNLIAFDEDQDTFEEEGGIFFGTSWVAMPIFGASERFDDQPDDLDGGLMTWTFFVDAANHSGPLIAYAPEHWSRRLDRWNAMDILDDVYGWEPGSPVADALLAYVDGEITSADLHEAIAGEEWYGGDAGGKEYGSPHWVRAQDTLGYSPARGYLPTGIEMSTVPAFEVVGQDGRVFLKIFPPKIPNASAREGYALNVQTFDVDLYNHFLNVFQPGANLGAADTRFDGLGIPMQVESWDDGPWRGIWIDEPEPEADEDEAGLSLRVPMLPLQQNGETDVYVDWGDAPANERSWGPYYEVVDGEAVAVDASAVPAELLPLAYKTQQHLVSEAPHEDPPPGYDFSCWTCDDPAVCDDTDHVTVLDDGSRITYRWFRFRDQPAFVSLSNEYPDRYSDAVLTGVQSVVESMHRDWGGTRQFLERPTNVPVLHLAEIDHGLIVEPPVGREHGWVPIVTRVDIPDGPQQEDDSIYRETGDGRRLLR